MKSNTVKKLRERISILENENRLLKGRLAEAGVSYADTYWRDISEAKSNVVIYSPRLNNEKVNRIIAELTWRCSNSECINIHSFEKLFASASGSDINLHCDTGPEIAGPFLMFGE